MGIFILLLFPAFTEHEKLFTLPQSEMVFCNRTDYFMVDIRTSTAQFLVLPFFLMSSARKVASPAVEFISLGSFRIHYWAAHTIPILFQIQNSFSAVWRKLQLVSFQRLGSLRAIAPLPFDSMQVTSGGLRAHVLGGSINNELTPLPIHFLESFRTIPADERDMDLAIVDDVVPRYVSWRCHDPKINWLSSAGNVEFKKSIVF